MYNSTTYEWAERNCNNMMALQDRKYRVTAAIITGGF